MSAISDLVLTEEWENCSTHGRWLRSFLQEGRWYSNPMCPACQKEATTRMLLGRASIPPRFAGRNFENYLADTQAQKDVLHTCRGYAGGFKSARRKGICLILHGRPGTGKNHLATAICLEVMQQGYEALIITAADLIARIREAYDVTSTDRESDIIRNFVYRIDLLVIDEIDKIKGTDAERNTMFRVIDGRYQDLRPTVILSNLNLGQIEQHLGAAIFDRLREGGGIAGRLDWPSHRRTSPDNTGVIET